MFAEPNYLSFTPNPAGGMHLYAEQLLPAPREAVFTLFADAFKLEELTPPWLNFHVYTPPPIEIKEGTLIDYRLRLHGFWIRWQSRIEVWQPPLRFVDVQTRGPYRHWRHEHSFLESPISPSIGVRATSGSPNSAAARQQHGLNLTPQLIKSPVGTLCKDSVEYAVPGGQLIERLFVRPDVTKIFQFRQRKLAEMFPA